VSKKDLLSKLKQDVASRRGIRTVRRGELIEESVFITQTKGFPSAHGVNEIIL
jgi:hypothetical protein